MATSTQNPGRRPLTPEQRAQRVESGRKGGKAVAGTDRSFFKDRELASAAGSKGGHAVPASRRTFATNRDLARSSGAKGGSSVPDEKRAFSVDPELARRAGARGGLIRVWGRDVVDRVLAMTPDVDEDTDGRWIAEYPDIPGSKAFGVDAEEAERKARYIALKILSEANRGALR